ncbi:Uncharacterised protein [Listeria grayi]|uniref:Uncharacterized protein n=1 Tax=Listeria grayi TaxID=1641 RepID=A0A378MIH7_LISGR|nr:Uncharacterised protein [Listeria grayi]
MYNQINKKKSKKPIWISIGIVAALIIIAAGVFLFIHFKNRALNEATAVSESFTKIYKSRNMPNSKTTSTAHH